ncbi:MAG: arylesterase [Pseudobdellovibrionaceae bacterium]
MKSLSSQILMQIFIQIFIQIFKQILIQMILQRRCLILIFIFFTANAYSLENKTAAKKLIIIGDSLTEGYGVAQDKAYPALLAQKLKDAKLNWEVVNSGISGSTTASALSRIRWVMKSKPDLIMLALGANDGLRGLKPEQSKKNLQSAVDLIQTEKINLILAGMLMPANYGKDYQKDFEKIYSDLAKANKLFFIPFLLEGVAGESQFNLPDGIHPNEKGHGIIAQHVFKSIGWEKMK